MPHSPRHVDLTRRLGHMEHPQLFLSKFMYLLR